ncbi:MAG TPA: type II toxin-antitoxin system VapC family toxin, partial [Caldilineaceae bacterium]|nr:type II toxin-antitoxin system VapC family toxin [Caldilineaceae bacterium]
MAHIFIDPSALLKQYIREKGSDRVRTLIASPTTETIFVAEIALAEVAAVIATKHRAPGGISEGMRQGLLARFLVDCKERYVLVKTDRPIIDRAVTLSQRYRLRGYSFSISSATSPSSTPPGSP